MRFTKCNPHQSYPPWLIAAMLALALAVCASAALATPNLQVYIPGGTYDAATETWVVTGVSSFDVQVIGSLTGTGSYIDNVTLAAALVPSTSTVPAGTSITMTPGSAVTGFGPLGQSAAWQSGTPNIYGTNPDFLPPHDVYPTRYMTYDMGRFNPLYAVADYQPPITMTSAMGEIKTVHVNIQGNTAVHFDAYNHVVAAKKWSRAFAPFSHDAEGSNVPEPGTLLLIATGMVGLFGVRRRSRTG